MSSSTPWVEKYRPKTLSEVSHQTEIVSTLHNAIESNRLPHLLFYGPPGTGKTSVALALCRQLWHPSQYKRRVLELNASDERGIGIVRNKVKNFASLSVGDSTYRRESEWEKYPNPPFKIIILDEADAITPDAQAALRRVIEAFSKQTRFILICNYVTRIIAPLASRCAKFRFQPLPSSSMYERLQSISKSENVTFTNEEQVLNQILDLSGGDMRRAVTTLQSAHALSSSQDWMEFDDETGDNKGTSSASGIPVESIAEIAGLPTQKVISDLIEGLSDGSFQKMEHAVNHVVAEGFSAAVILNSLLEHLILSEDGKLGDEEKSILSIKMAEADKLLVDGADDFLQLLSVCSVASKCVVKKRRRDEKEL